VERRAEIEKRSSIGKERSFFVTCAQAHESRESALDQTDEIECGVESQLRFERERAGRRIFEARQIVRGSTQGSSLIAHCAIEDAHRVHLIPGDLRLRERARQRFVDAHRHLEQQLAHALAKLRRPQGLARRRRAAAINASRRGARDGGLGR
jgi:hypothetical protein